MAFLDVSQRPDRHKDLLDAAEALGKSALIHFERGDAASIEEGSRMALEIAPTTSGDIGWQVVDVGILLTRHKAALTPNVRTHLERLLSEAVRPWSDREFGRGNVNHPVIATWIYAAAGQALGRDDYARIADSRLQRFIHIFSQVGDMSEYNSPTYLGPTLVGLACIGEHAALHSTRLRARLIEERIWLSTMARWHPPSQQLAGPHSRAYADSTLGFASILRYLMHAVLAEMVFWDNELALTYDHHYEAEWAARIAACVFNFPDYLRAIGEQKRYPYEVQSITDGEDYTVDGKEVYRGGEGRLTTYLTQDTCLGSSERPYVDAGQTEMCIAYWKRSAPVRQVNDLRALYFRYITNDRLPGQENTYYAWYGGAERSYSPNLLHQDGRQHVLQHNNKAILLAQPLKRENGRITSLRFDALLPLYAPLDEIWLGEIELSALPALANWDKPVLIRDGSVFLALIPLQPTDLGGAAPALEIATVNQHLIVSIYNLRGSEPRAFPAYVLDHCHNGLVMEIGTAGEYRDFAAFRRHIAQCQVSERLWLEEIREITYRSGQDTLAYRYHPGTQETCSAFINGRPLEFPAFSCPDAVQGSSGRLAVGNIVLETDPGVPAWLACKPDTGWVTVTLPTDQPSALRLDTPTGVVECESFAGGQIRLHWDDPVEIELACVALRKPLRVSGFANIERAVGCGGAVQLSQKSAKEWELS